MQSRFKCLICWRISCWQKKNNSDLFLNTSSVFIPCIFLFSRHLSLDALNWIILIVNVTVNVTAPNVWYITHCLAPLEPLEISSTLTQEEEPLSGGIPSHLDTCSNIKFEQEPECPLPSLPEPTLPPLTPGRPFFMSGEEEVCNNF